MSNFDQNYRSGKYREQYILSLLNKNGYNAEIYEIPSSRKRTDWDFSEPMCQDVFIHGKRYISPDINIYQTDRQIVFRIEVKSFRDIGDISRRFGVDVVGVEKYKLESYYQLQQAQEIPTMIVFVIGEEECYEIYWEYLNNLVGKIKRKQDSLFGKTAFFWRLQDLNKGKESFITELKWAF